MIFPESLLRDVDFGIDIHPDARLISIPPYIIAQAKLIEIKEQLKIS